MTGRQACTDGELARAIARCTSWRGVLRDLGMPATSAGAMRSLRRRADLLGVDYGHFTGQRRWTDDALRSAVETAETWSQVARQLGLEDPAPVTALRGHALRLGLQDEHLAVEPATTPHHGLEPEAAHLRRAGALLAASWFSLCGHDVSWPLEPSRYDLLVERGGRLRRVQVKTTTSRSGQSWKVYLSTSRRGRTVYGPDEIDDFFIVDADLAFYLIPVAVVGGLHAVHLAAYDRYRLPPLALGGTARGDG